MQSDFSAIWPYRDDLLQAIVLTLELAVTSTVLGFILGTLAAVGRTGRQPVVRALIAGYVELIRNTPLLVQAFLLYFGLASAGPRLSATTAAAIALTINVAAYTCEIVRAGLEATPKEQLEAAESLALKPWQVVWYVKLAPAIARVYPALTSQYVLLLLATSIASQISVDELTGMAYRIQSSTFRSTEVFLVAAAVYLTLSILFRIGFKFVGTRLFSPERLAAESRS